MRSNFPYFCRAQKDKLRRVRYFPITSSSVLQFLQTHKWTHNTQNIHNGKSIRCRQCHCMTHFLPSYLEGQSGGWLCGQIVRVKAQLARLISHTIRRKLINYCRCKNIESANVSTLGFNIFKPLQATSKDHGAMSLFQSGVALLLQNLLLVQIADHEVHNVVGHILLCEGDGSVNRGDLTAVAGYGGIAR